MLVCISLHLHILHPSHSLFCPHCLWTYGLWSLVSCRLLWSLFSVPLLCVLVFGPYTCVLNMLSLASISVFFILAFVLSGFWRTYYWGRAITKRNKGKREKAKCLTWFSTQCMCLCPRLQLGELLFLVYIKALTRCLYI